jgi:O-antigen ligase
MESFSTFAREKGNSILAVVEELGILGLVLYLMLVYSVWHSFRQLARAPNSEIKFVHRLSLGFYFGALLHSGFEAWFMSSSPDVAVFWATLGLLLGALALYSRQANERFSRLETATGSRVFIPSPSPHR